MGWIIIVLTTLVVVRGSWESLTVISNIVGNNCLMMFDVHLKNTHIIFQYPIFDLSYGGELTVISTSWELFTYYMMFLTNV